MELRPYAPADCAAMAELFYNTVHTVNARDYTPEQLCAWATGEVDLAEWDRSFQAHHTPGGRGRGADCGIWGFGRGAGLSGPAVRSPRPPGGGNRHRPVRRPREGGTGPITTHASITARPFFEGRGYRVLREQRVERRGVWLTNYVMGKK